MGGEGVGERGREKGERARERRPSTCVLAAAHPAESNASRTNRHGRRPAGRHVEPLQKRRPRMRRAPCALARRFRRADVAEVVRSLPLPLRRAAIKVMRKRERERDREKEREGERERERERELGRKSESLLRARQRAD